MGLTRKQIVIVVILLAGTLLAVLNQTLLSPALPAIMTDTQVDATTVQWLTSAYSLVEAVVIPLSAYLIGRFPTKKLFIFGMTIFGIGSLLAAIAPFFAVLLIGRMCQAVATGIAMPMVFTVILLIFPRENAALPWVLFLLLLALLLQSALRFQVYLSIALVGALCFYSSAR